IKVMSTIKNSLMRASSLGGIDTCPMEGIDPAGFDEVLGLQALDLTTSVVCTLGYRNTGDKQALKPKIRFAGLGSGLDL
ncbi:MAG: hypothetical protein V7700_15345, partial [Halioglobus sp.]